MTSSEPHYKEGRSILADVVPLKTPFSIQIEATDYCNLRCNYCIRSAKKGTTMMTRATMESIVDEMEELDEPLRQVNFSGWGEPLLNPLLPDFISLIHNREVAKNIAVVTNGLLLNPSVSQSLVESKVSHIRISLQGIDSSKYLEISGARIYFDSLLNRVKYLYEISAGRCEISVKVADIALEPGDESKFYELFDGICDRMYIENIRPVFTPDDGRHISKFGIEHPPAKVCPQPFFMLSVTAAGDVLPCCSHYDPTSLGKIEDISLRKLWTSRQMYAFRLMMLGGKRKEQNVYPACQTCTIPDVVVAPEDELDSKAKEIEGRL
jgi:MoaA/NifB/PqqE/SkfB family radical SAM enzyme